MNRVKMIIKASITKIIYMRRRNNRFDHFKKIKSIFINVSILIIFSLEANELFLYFISIIATKAV